MSTQGSSGGSRDKAVELARMTLQNVLSPAEGDVTATNETLVQNALHLLRRTACEPAVVARFEDAAISLRMMVEAKRVGRTNLYQSRLLRLRRSVAAL